MSDSILAGINAGFDGGLANDLPQIAGLKFGRVRRDVPVSRAAEFLNEFKPYPYIHVGAILRSAFDASPAEIFDEARALAEALSDAGLASRCSIEIGNEPDISKTWAEDPRLFGQVVNSCAKTIDDVDDRIEVISGGVSNTSPKHQAWLKRAVAEMDNDITVGYHRYITEASPETPHKGFATRDAEDAALKALMGTHKFALTEFGWHTKPWVIKIWGIPVKRGRFTYDQVAGFAAREIKRQIAMGALYADWYQLQDAPDDHDQGFGIRFLANSDPKPVALVFEQFWAQEPQPNSVSVSFRVVDGTDPIAGAKFTLGQDDEAGTQIHAVSDSRGSVLFTSSTPGWGCSVRLEREGFDPISERRQIPAVSTIGEVSWYTTMRRPVATVTAQTEQGGPVEGASVTIRHDSPDVPLASSTTNAAGYTTYSTAIPGWGVQVDVSKDGYLSQSARHALPLVSNPGWLTLVMRPTKKPLPPVPTREQVCKIKYHMQGLSYQTRDYGKMPAPFFWTAYQDRLTCVYPAHRAVGDTHLPVGVSGSYKEPNTVWPPEISNGSDLTNNLPAFKAILREVITEGFFCDIPLSGDGQSVRTDGSTIHYGEYSDPVGSTYGHTWLMQNLQRIIKAIRGDADGECPDGEDLTPYCIIRPGWDGVF